MSSIVVPVMYREQAADACVDFYEAYNARALNARQWEWTGCGYYKYGVETGLVSGYLGEDYLPVALGGSEIPNRGVKDFSGWFEGGVASEIVLDDDGNDVVFSDFNFQPVDGLFTMQMTLPVKISEKASILVTADDDTWVFLNNELLIDMGGIHEAATREVAVDAADTAVVRIFHANRDSGTGSVFKLGLSNMTVDTAAMGEGYAAPLGVTNGNGYRQSLMSAMILETLLVLVIAAMVAIFAGRKYLHRGRNRE